MTRIRTHISILLGLLLLVQGMAAAAAPVMAMTSAKAQVTAIAERTAEAEMPCHKQQAEPVKADETRPACPCCDGDCPDMQACAGAQPAMASAIRLDLPRLKPAMPAPIEVSLAIHRTSSLLKPPISLQA
jgi:hypothetical protein